jgi:hypothetical protein
MSAVTAVAVLRAAYPGKFPEESVRLYTRMLDDVPEAELLAAVERLIRSDPAEWLPTIAKIRRNVATDLLGLPGRDEAWAWASDASRPLKGDAPQALIDAVNGQGGRWNILHAENQTVVKAQFLADYDSAVARSIQRAAAAPGCLPPPEPIPQIEGPQRLGETMASLPVTKYIHPRPLVVWALTRHPPTEREKQDAIQVLRDFPADDPLSMAALEMLDQVGRG